MRVVTARYLHRPRFRAAGFTLIELMVAMAVGLLIVLAAAAALLVARRGYATVDAASQLRDNARFAAELIERISVQAGYRDVSFASAPMGSSDAVGTSASIGGFNNALIDATNPLTSSSARTAGVAGHGSDVLILRYQASQLYATSTDDNLGVKSDRTMIDCAGNSPAAVLGPAAANAREARMFSIFHVAVNQGEPTLMCTHQDPVTNAIVTMPLVSGVEQFKVLYGTDGVKANEAPTSAAAAPNLPTNFRRADEMVVPGDANATIANWRRVRAIRIGLILRSDVGNTQGNQAVTLHPFGNPGLKSSFAAPADGRLRQVVSFTVHLRNDQGA